MDSVYNACLQSGTSRQLQEFSTICEESEKTSTETYIIENYIQNENSELTNVKTNKITEEIPFYEFCNKYLQINEYLIICNQDSTSKNEEFKEIDSTSKNEDFKEIDSTSKNEEFKEIEATNTPKYNKPHTKCRKVKEVRHICEICNKEFRRKYNLKEHLLNHNVNKPYVCNVCDKGFVRKDHLARHSQVHKHKKYVCECYVCKIFANDKAATAKKCGSVNLHQSHEDKQDLTPAEVNLEQQSADVDHTVKSFKCHICNKSYTTKGHLNRHLKANSSNQCKTKNKSPKQYNCEICNKQFKRKHSFTEHQFIHIGKKPFVCVICNTCYSRRGSLSRHLKSHTYNQFNCDICYKDYGTERALKRHSLTTHTKLKQFICDACNKTFINKQYLIDHLKIHTAENVEKKFVCEICKKCYKKKYSLQLHLMTHTNKAQTPYKCYMCDKSYRQKQHLNHHLRFKHMKTNK